MAWGVSGKVRREVRIHSSGRRNELIGRMISIRDSKNWKRKYAIKRLMGLKQLRINCQRRILHNRINQTGD